MQVQQELDKLPRRRSLRGGVGGIFGSDIVIHRSPLVRYSAKYRSYKGKDIFAALYLSKQPGAEGLDWGREVRALGESLSREEDRYRKMGDQDEKKED